MPRLHDRLNASTTTGMPPNSVTPTSTVPSNWTPIGSNPFVRSQTPIARLGANVNIPAAQPPGQRR
jgi:hypothetical protein